MPAKPVGNLHESSFNLLLAKALGKADPRHRDGDDGFQPERVGQRKGGMRPDIRVSSDAVIECAYGGDGDKDALVRLDAGFETAFAVAVPTAFKHMSEEDAAAALERGSPLLEYAVLQDGFRFPFAGYLKGEVRQFAEFVRAASVPMKRVEAAASEVLCAIEKGKRLLEGGLSAGVVAEVGRQVRQDASEQAIRTVLLLWLDAMLVQEHLARADNLGIPLLPLTGDEATAADFVKAWRKILDVNWRAVFKPAVEALELAGAQNRKAVGEALGLLVDAVNALRDQELGDMINIGAELFPKLSADRKTAAAFYTTPATAELLVSMTVRKGDRQDWGRPNLLKWLRGVAVEARGPIKMGDLACGTGTLLRAGYRKVRSLHEAATGQSADGGDLHKDAMEGGLVGGDVSPIAAHLSNSSMAVMGDRKPYGTTQIGYISVGEPVSGKGCTTGTLELMDAYGVVDMFNALGDTAKGKGDEKMGGIEARVNSFDYLFMNPPYSRTRGGQKAFDIAGLSDEARKGCQRRWGTLLRGQPATKTAGMAASFLCVARNKVRPGGRIGFVLPSTAASAPSWAKTRAMIADEFEEVIAIAKSGQSGGDDGLSADTHMGEMMLIATKRTKVRKKKEPLAPVHCVSLRRMPLRLGEAAAFGTCILEAVKGMRSSHTPILAGDEELGTVSRFQPRGGEPWAALGVLHSDLDRAAMSLIYGGALPGASGEATMRIKVPMSSISNLFEVGPTHHLIGHLPFNDPIGAFAWFPITRKADLRGTLRSLWKADAKEQTALVVNPTHKGEEHDADKANRMRDCAGNLHYARGMRWTAQSVLAATTEQKAFGGSAWTTLLHGDVRIAKAFALWANSTLGLLTHWTQGGRQQEGRARTQLGAIKAMPCPDLSALPSIALDAADEAFAELSKLRLKPACQAHADDGRKRIDEAVVAMLGLPRRQAMAALEELRGQWCAEPTVHGSNRQAVALLKQAGLAGDNEGGAE